MTGMMARTLLKQLSQEVAAQPKALEELSSSRMDKARTGSVFVGAGDSYAAALTTFYLSQGRCLALDPYALMASPQIAAGREVFFISVSGRTSANVAAARKVRNIAERTVALTADTTSLLASSTDETVKLPFTSVPRSSGLLSFSLSLLAAVMIATREASSSVDFRRVFKTAQSDSKRVQLGRGTTYFLANAAGYAVAIYSAAKVYEMFGSKSDFEMLEEFSHTKLFSLSKEDSVNIFSCFDPLDMGKRLQRALLAHGYQAHLVPSHGSSNIEQLFHAVFVAQLAVLSLAEVQRLTRPQFQDAEDKLKISDDMIY